MRFLKDKKGFTLIELLAVIIVLAVVTLLAVQAVLPQVEKARRNAFIIEANNAIEAAKQWYTDKVLTNPTEVSAPTVCVKMGTLKNGYYDTNNDEIKGYVKIAKTSTTTTYSINMTNGSFQTKQETPGKLSSSDATGDNAKIEAAVAGGITDSSVPQGITACK